ncbi:hypothetical protein ACGFMO_37330 [Streptomyces niveus]|uniref:hypothetical protein n=1 Tax=Streptomyces niveus TaxID=193462 RepID=UPI00371BA149
MKTTRFCVVAVAALVLAGTTTPASASATVERGNVTLKVTGKGLRVDRAGGWRDGHGTGVKGRLYAVHPDSGRYEVRAWKSATRMSAGNTRFSDVDWTLNTRFAPGTKLCLEFNKGATGGTPCARIHD